MAVEITVFQMNVVVLIKNWGAAFMETQKVRLNCKEIKELVEKIVQQARSLYNNNPKCYRKVSGVDDSEFLYRHPSKAAIYEMIEEEVSHLSQVEVRSVVSFGMLHYYPIDINYMSYYVYPHIDMDKRKLVDFLQGKCSEADDKEFTNHVLYHCGRINYWSRVLSARSRKKTREADIKAAAPTTKVIHSRIVHPTVTHYPLTPQPVAAAAAKADGGFSKTYYGAYTY